MPVKPALQTHPDDEIVTTCASYELTLHPGVVSRAEVDRRGSSPTTLYHQMEVHSVTMKGHPKAWHVRLKGGPEGRDLDLYVGDPRHEVARITIELFSEGYDPAVGDLGEISESVIIHTQAKTCPPFCTV